MCTRVGYGLGDPITAGARVYPRVYVQCGHWWISEHEHMQGPKAQARRHYVLALLRLGPAILLKAVYA